MFKLILILSLAQVFQVFGATKFFDAGQNIDSQWNEYKSQYGKNYANPMEDAQRKSNFANTLQMISQINSQYGEGYLAVNKFADYSDEETANMRGGLLPEGDAKSFDDSTYTYNLSALYPESKQGGDSADWRWAATPVKDQLECGSCWAFAAAAVVESNWKLYQRGEAVSLSDQQLLDCTSPGDQNNNGCGGGYVHQALEHLQNSRNTLVREHLYRYTGNKGNTCRRVNGDGATVSQAIYSSRGEAELADWVKNRGTVAIWFAMHPALKSIGRGQIWDGPCGTRNDGHLVQVVGYTRDYWVCKNSWGAGWGDDGYFHLRRGRQTCGVGQYYGFARP